MGSEAVDLTQDCSEKQCQNENFEADLEAFSQNRTEVRGSVKNPLGRVWVSSNKYSD